ncbi:MAG: heavy-metal-associated domain-containing protein [Butyrivibrio sp.]|nr:heavy-metal-associated domain-containing protein [Butyrivibrio sp.]
MYKTTAKIDGMMCSMCESHINETIRKAFPSAKSVKSSHVKGETSFVTDDEVNIDKLRKAIEQTGYQFLKADSTVYEKKGLFGFLK